MAGKMSHYKINLTRGYSVDNSKPQFSDCGFLQYVMYEISILALLFQNIMHMDLKGRCTACQIWKGKGCKHIGTAR